MQLILMFNVSMQDPMSHDAEPEIEEANALDEEDDDAGMLGELFSEEHAQEIADAGGISGSWDGAARARRGRSEDFGRESQGFSAAAAGVMGSEEAMLHHRVAGVLQAGGQGVWNDDGQAEVWEAGGALGVQRSADSCPMRLGSGPLQKQHQPGGLWQGGSSSSDLDESSSELSGSDADDDDDASCNSPEVRSTACSPHRSCSSDTAQNDHRSGSGPSPKSCSSVSRDDPVMLGAERLANSEPCSPHFDVDALFGGLGDLDAALDALLGGSKGNVGGDAANCQQPDARGGVEHAVEARSAMHDCLSSIMWGFAV